jgi:hypothetical protein
MNFIKKNWLLLLAGIAAIYFLFINKSALSNLLGSTASSGNSTIDPLSDGKRYPPPGYSGPSDIGPFNWAGVGDPPDGKWTVLGLTYAQARAAHII